MATIVHRLKYYNPKPQSINCVSFNKITKHLAVARADASIEIWNLEYAPYLTKFIPGVENSSIEALAWVNYRLLSTGLAGALLEWDLDKLSLKTTVLLTGYAAWCLDVNNTQTLVAVGTEQGYLNLYSVENNEIVYKKLFDKQEGRILCCKFDKPGNILVTGSINSIRVWNVETGQAITRISVSRRGQETIVWSLAILSDNVIVSGDSLGRLTFWDGTLGDQIESFTTHKADIFTIVVSDDEKSLYCSGVDPLIVNFVKIDKIKGKASTEACWVRNMHRYIHEHDVRALLINGQKLVSMGADGYITLSSYSPKWVMRIPPMIPPPRSCVCAKKKLLLLRYSTHLEVWKLGSYGTSDKGKPILNTPVRINTNEDERETKDILEEDSLEVTSNKIEQNSQKQSLKVSENPVKLVTIHSKKNKQIQSCAMSPDGDFIVYSTDSDVRMLKLETDDDGSANVSLSKVAINGLEGSWQRLWFGSALAAARAGEVAVLVLDAAGNAERAYHVNTSKHLKSPSILHVQTATIEELGLVMVAADAAGSVAVWTRRNKKLEHHVSLPKHRSVPTALTVDENKKCLIVVYADQKLVEYDLMNKKFSDWPQKSLPPAWFTREAAATRITLHPHRDALVLQDHTSLWVLERAALTNKKSEDSAPEPEKKTKRKETTGKNCNLKIIPIKYVADFHWLGANEAACVELLPENIVSQLPPTLANKKYYIA